MKRIIIDFWVGIFIIIGLLSLAFLATKVAIVHNFTYSNNKNYVLKAAFSNIGSLKINAPVKISGFIIGNVTAINLNPTSYQAVVTMEINDQYHLSLDTAAQILTTGLLGEQYISLQPGADKQELQNGDNISITSSALVLENLIGKFITNIK